MELGSIHREIHIDAPLDVVFQVVSDPTHVARWWPDEAHYRAVPGGKGEIVFRSPNGEQVETFEVVDVVPPRLFSFRWTQPPGIPATAGNSFLVVFELSAEATGTRLRMTESGFLERGWETAVLEEAYRDHRAGWDHFLPRIAPYVAEYLERAR